MHFIITVDTEADYQKRGDDVTAVKNLSALPRFQALCDRYGMKPTYLITHEVTKDTQTVERLAQWQNDGDAEVGAHLHPWTTPPIISGDSDLRFPSDLSDEELQNKFATLIAGITSAVGRAPTSYRAGRWGLDQRQEKLLLENGFVVDCSITPSVNWKRMGGPDFRDENVLPRIRESGIYEIPITIIPTGIFRNIKSSFVKYFQNLSDGIHKKMLNKLLFNQKWLRVFPGTTNKELISVYNSAVYNKLGVLEFMIHSSELALGTSKYTKTEKEVEHMYERIEFLFSFLRAKGIVSTTLTGFAKCHQKS